MCPLSNIFPGFAFDIVREILSLGFPRPLNGELHFSREICCLGLWPKKLGLPNESTHGKCDFRLPTADCQLKCTVGKFHCCDHWRRIQNVQVRVARMLHRSRDSATTCYLKTLLVCIDCYSSLQ